MGDDGRGPESADTDSGAATGGSGVPEDGTSLEPVADLSPEQADAEIGELVGKLSEAEGLDAEARTRMLARLGRLLAHSARRAGAKGVATGRWMTDVFADIAPRIPFRDLETLSAHHHGLRGERLADSLVRTAANATTAVGAAGGALAAVEFVTPPLLLTAPAQITAEALVVAAIEVKMIAELHEVYGVQLPGGHTARGSAFAGAWAKERGVNPLEPGSITYALGAAAKQALRKRLLRTVGRSMTTMGPFLTGALAGGALNRAATRRLADHIRKDLRRMLGSADAPRALPE
jgi:hypothetical protein